MAWGIQDMPSEDSLMNKYGHLVFDTEEEAQAYLDSFPRLARPSRFAPVNALTFYPSGRPGTAYAERMKEQRGTDVEFGAGVPRETTNTVEFTNNEEVSR